MSLFNERLKECRLNKGLTQKQAAEIFGVNIRHWQAYEGGTRTPTFEKLITLANYFDVSTDYLIGRSEDPKMH